jgi:hypothetical protein
LIEWRAENGEALCKIGPYRLHASKSLERDRAPGKEFDARVWRNGASVAMETEYESVEVAKLKCIDLMRKVLRDELALMAYVERALSQL